MYCMNEQKTSKYHAKMKKGGGERKKEGEGKEGGRERRLDGG